MKRKKKSNTARVVIYTTLMFTILMLPVMYQNYRHRVANKTWDVREKKIDWIGRACKIDFRLAREAKTEEDWLYHTNKGRTYLRRYLTLVMEKMGDFKYLDYKGHYLDGTEGETLDQLIKSLE